jgi:DNA polymerase (family 10)
MPKGSPQDVPDVIEKIGELLEIRGKEADAFRIRAYKRAAQALRDHSGEIERLVKEGTLTELAGIGDAIAEKVAEYLETGRIKAYEDLKKKMPEGLLELLSVPSLGPKKVKLLYQKLNVKSITDLKRVIAAGKLLGLPGIQERMIEKIKEGIALVEEIGRRRLLGEIKGMVEELLHEFKKCKTITRMDVGGSYRRREETIGDIDVLVLAKKRNEVAAFVRKLPNLEKVIAEGEKKISFLLKGNLQTDIRMIEEEEWGAALQYFTGSKAHNVELRSYAKSKGMKVSEYGVFRTKTPRFQDSKIPRSVRRSTEERIAGRTEEEVYKALGMDYIEPELRQGSGEIQAALAGRLPKLVELKDIRGDLHVHSTWSSDGKETIENMARAAEALGYEYICIADHSPSIGIAAGPKTKPQILKKKEEIERVQKKVNIKILNGTEVDIRADGSLDYSDDILKEFDFIIAAIHSGFSRDNTDRLLKAIEHPLVSAIAHPTGRHFGVRNSYPMNEDLVFQKAAETGTFLEINGQPVRLDLPFNLVRKAKEWSLPRASLEGASRGVRFVINTDAHSAGGLSLMDLGVSVARRGWLEKGDVANALSLKDFLRTLRKAY